MRALGNSEIGEWTTLVEVEISEERAKLDRINAALAAPDEGLEKLFDDKAKAKPAAA